MNEPPPNMASLGESPSETSQLNHLMEIAAIRQSETEYRTGDVLAVVHFYEQDGVACDARKWETFKMRMSSKRLLEMRSTKITKMLEPRAQARFRRHNISLTIPAEVKYLIDFTPDCDSDDFVQLFTELSLPEMVRLWFLAGKYTADSIIETSPNKWMEPRQTSKIERPEASMSVGACLTLGHDDRCSWAPCYDSRLLWEGSIGVPGIVDNPLDVDEVRHIAVERMVPDYCRVRHRLAIIRLLRTINGSELVINSAPRMWTLVWVANHLELTDLVRDYVASWLLAQPNTKFIEMFPEGAFKIGNVLKIQDVVHASFKILVNELAMDYALVHDKAPVVKALYTFSQRKRDTHFESEAVDYAARSLCSRLQGHARQLQDHHAAFTRSYRSCNGTRVPTEWEKLELVGGFIEVCMKAIRYGYEHIVLFKLKMAHGRLMAQLKSDYQHLIPSVLSDEAPSGHLLAFLEAQRDHYIHPSQKEPIQKRYAALKDEQKMLTSIFWYGVKTQAMHAYPYSSDKTVGQTYNDQLDEACSNVRELHEMLEETFPHLSCASFSWRSFAYDVRSYLFAYCDAILKDDTLSRKDKKVILLISDHMVLNMTPKETKYLPDWAGGMDDASFGTFQDMDIPDTDMGPSEPGPAFQTGHTVGARNELNFRACPPTVEPSEPGPASHTGHTVGAPSELNFHTYPPTVEPSDIPEKITEGVASLALTEPASIVDDNHSYLQDTAMGGSINTGDGNSTVYSASAVLIAPSTAVSESFVSDDELYQQAIEVDPGQQHGTNDVVHVAAASDASSKTENGDFEMDDDLEVMSFTSSLQQQ